MAKVKISELPALTPATLDTTFVVGISGSTTYKISINQLTSSLDTTFATDLVTAALSSSLDGKLSTSSFNSYTSSYTTDSSSFNSRIISGSAVAGTISSSIQISGLGFITASTPTDLSSLNTISASYLSFTQSYYSASSSFDSRIDGLENATSSYLTSLNGAISSSAQVLNGSGIYSSSTQLPDGLVSGSSQLTSSFDTRYALSSSISTTPTLYLLEAYANVTYTLPDSFIEDPCRYSVVNNTVNVSSSWFNTSTYTFTPQKAGYWEITAAYDVYRNSEAAMAIKKNNGIVVTAGAFGAVSQQVTKIVYLNGSTDFINVVNVGGAANSRSQYEGRSWFQARWVGE
jgi:hypothetical protein